MKRKHWVLLILVLVLVTFSTACGNADENPAALEPEDPPQIEESEESSRIEVKGTFLLEPSSDLDLSKEELDPVQRYLFLVYDVTSSDSINEELFVFPSSVAITMNDTNTYEQLDVYGSTVLSTFLENCGYAVSTRYGTLWAGNEPVRMIATFAINGNDVKEDCTATVEFQLAETLHASVDMEGADIQTIHWMDKVFSVEDNPDAYQIACSVRPRAQLCKKALENSAQADHDGQDDTRTLNLAICQTIFSEEAVWGVSCSSAVGNAIFSESLPAFKVDSVQLYFPEIADKIETVSECIEIVSAELEKDSPDYDNANSAKNQAYNTLIEIIDYFDKN